MSLSSYFSPLVNHLGTLPRNAADLDENQSLNVPTEALAVIDIGESSTCNSNSKISREDRDNLCLLNFCSDQLPQDLILHLWDPQHHKPKAEMEKRLKYLCSMELLKWDKSSQCYFRSQDLHSVTLLNADAGNFPALQRTFRDLLDFTTSVSPTSRNYRLYLQNVLVCARHLVDSSDPEISAGCLRSLLPLEDLFTAFGLSTLWEEILCLGATRLDLQTQVSSGTTLALAMVYSDIGKFARALEKFQETISFCESFLHNEINREFGHVAIDVDDVNAGRSICVEGAEGNTTEKAATPMTDHTGCESETLRVVETLQGPCPETNQILSTEEAMILSTKARLGTATVLLSTGQHEKASELLHKAEESLERVSDTAAAANLHVKMEQVKSTIFLHVGKAPEAIQTLQRVLSTLDENSLTFFKIQSEVAVHTSESGESHSALKIFENVLPNLLSLTGKENDHYLGALHNKALAQKRIGEKIQALHLLEKVIRVRERVFGPDHPESVRTLISKAELLIDLDRLEDSRKVLDEVNSRIDHTELEVEKLRVFHSLALIQCREEVVRVQKGLAQIKVAVNTEERTAVLSLMLQVFNKSKEVFGPRHPFTLRVAHNAAVAYVIGGSFERAAMLYTAVEALQTEVFGPKHSEVSTTTKNISRCGKLARILGVVTLSKSKSNKSSEDVNLPVPECLPMHGNGICDLPFVF